MSGAYLGTFTRLKGFHEVTYHCYDATRMSSSVSPLKKLRIVLTKSPFRSFQTHIASLLFSSAFYLVAFIVLDSRVGSDKGAQATKIVLWYLPVLLEIAAHYLALSQPGHVPYPTKGVFERCAAAFVIILGAGKIFSIRYLITL